MRQWLIGFVLVTALAAQQPTGQAAEPAQTSPAAPASSSTRERPGRNAHVSAMARRTARLFRGLRQAAGAEPVLAERLSSWGIADRPATESARGASQDRSGQTARVQNRAEFPPDPGALESRVEKRQLGETTTGSPAGGSDYWLPFLPAL